MLSLADEAGKAIDVSCVELVAEKFPQERLDVGTKFCFFHCTEEVGERSVVLFLPLELSFGERMGRRCGRECGVECFVLGH